MKHFILVALLLGGLPTRAAIYYLAATGNDANTPAQAQNSATPWQTLARLNTAMPLLQPGDQVLFRRGDVFRGQLVVTRSGTSTAPLTFGAYGPAGAAAPVLSGSAPLSGWVSAGPNLWEAPSPGTAAVTGVYAANGRALPLGRYPNLTAPNKGYLTIASHAGNTQLTAPQLSGNWTGATAVVRSIRWVLDRAPVTGHTGSTLTLGAFENPYYTRNGLPDGWGFFLQNHPATLDQNGEWYYYPTRSVIRVYAAAAPANGALEATTDAPAGVLVQNQQYLVFENLTLARTPRLAFDGNNLAHVVLRGLQVLGTDENGLRLRGTGTDVLLEGSLFSGVNNNAVAVAGYTDFTFRSNTLRANGVVPGRGISGDGQYYTLTLDNDNRVGLEGNVVDSCGYVGLSYFGTSNITIAHNVVSNFCLIKDDGGGIYTYNGGTPFNNVNGQITENTVLNGRGAPEGTNEPTNFKAFGIYLDDCTRNVVVQGNTVAECGSGGIFLHGNTAVTVQGNTSFNNGAQMIMEAAGSCTNTAHAISNNIFVSAQPDALVADYHVAPALLGQLGTLNNNYYAQPFNDVLHLRYEYQNLLLSEWQARSNRDAGSADGPVRYRPYRVLNFTSSELLTNGGFNTGLTGWGYWASSGGQVIHWDNTNALGSGGSLRLVATTPSAAGAIQAHGTLGSVVQGRSYVVRFNARSSGGPHLLEVFLQQSTPPYGDLTPSRRVVALGATAQSFEVTFPATANDPSAILTFQGPEDTRTCWLDNVTVREATLMPASQADSVRLEYNTSAAPRTVTLPAGGRYLDVRRMAYAGSFVLAPYASVVLFRVNAAVPTAARAVTTFNLQLWPNPSPGMSTLDLSAMPAGSHKVVLLDAVGRPVRRFSLMGGSAHTVDLTGLPAGVYVLQGQGESDGTRFSLRVLKE